MRDEESQHSFREMRCFTTFSMTEQRCTEKTLHLRRHGAIPVFTEANGHLPVGQRVGDIFQIDNLTRRRHGHKRCAHVMQVLLLDLQRQVMQMLAVEIRTVQRHVEPGAAAPAKPHDRRVQHNPHRQCNPDTLRS